RVRREAVLLFTAEGDGLTSTISTDNLSEWKAFLTTPFNVRGVTECAHHQDSCPFRRIDQFARKDRHRRPKERSNCASAEEAPIPRIVRVRGRPHTGRKKLRSGCLDREGLFVFLGNGAEFV